MGCVRTIFRKKEKKKQNLIRNFTISKRIQQGVPPSLGVSDSLCAPTGSTLGEKIVSELDLQVTTVDSCSNSKTGQDSTNIKNQIVNF